MGKIRKSAAKHAQKMHIPHLQKKPDFKKLKALTNYTFNDEDLLDPHKVKFMKKLIKSAVGFEKQKISYGTHDHNRIIGLISIKYQLENWQKKAHGKCKDLP